MPNLHAPDDILDYFRILLCGLSVYSFAVLILRYRRVGRYWNQKTTDYWYALLMWTMGGAVFTVQAIVLDRPFTVGTVFLTAAILVSAKAVHRKGPWGGDST